MKKTILIGIMALAVVFAGGCIFIAGNTVEPDRFGPGKEINKVGGGFEIFYKVPEEGTAVLADKKSGKTIRTLSLKEGEMFEFTSRAFDEKAYKDMGIDPKKADFVLYFYPKNPKPPVLPQLPLPPQPPMPPQQ
jgi:hypothetical protein